MHAMHSRLHTAMSALLSTVLALQPHVGPDAYTTLCELLVSNRKNYDIKYHNKEFHNHCSYQWVRARVSGRGRRGWCTMLCYAMLCYALG